MRTMFFALVVTLMAVCGCTYETTTIGYSDRDAHIPTFSVDIPKKDRHIMVMDSELFHGQRNNPDETAEAWSMSGTLKCLETTQSVSMQASFGEIGTHTVQLQVKYPPFDPFIPAPVTAEVFVEWSVKGNTVRRRASLSNGLSISGNAEAVKVRVVDTSTDPTLVGITYEVTITVVKGMRASNTQQPTLYLGKFAVAAGGVTDIPIPQDAGGIAVKVLGDGTDVIALQTLGGGPFFFSFWQVTRSEWQPLAGGCIAIQLSSVAGASNVAVYVGIDG